MNLNFERIRISNFLSFGEDIEVSLQNQGLCLVKGENRDDQKSKSNMSGKSAFIDAVVFCLFGEPYRNLKSKDIIRDGQDYCEVSLWMNEGLQLTRRISRKDPNSLMFQKTPIEQVTVEKELLGINFKQFISTILFGDETANKKLSLFAEGTNSERFTLVTPILNSDTWKRGKQNAEEKTGKLQSDLTQVQSELSKVESSLENLNTRIDDKRGQFQGIKTRMNTMEQDKAKEEVEIKHKIKELEDEMVSLCEQPISKEFDKDLEKTISDLEGKERLLKGNIEKLRVEINSLLTRHSDLKAIYAEKAVLLKQKQSLFHEVQCPLCKQDLKSGVKKGLQAEINAAEKDIRNREAEMKSTMSLKSSAENDILQIEELIKQGQGDMELVQDRLEKYKEWDSELHAIDDSITMRKDQLKAIDDMYAAQEKQVKVEFEQAETALDTFLKEQHELGVKARECQTQVNKLEFEINHESFWIKGYGSEGAPNIDLREKLPLLNEKIRELVPTLLSMDYQIDVSGQRQLKSSKKIKNEIGLDMLGGGFWRCSHGEKQRINTIIQIALGSLYGVQSNCLFFDEYFSGLDAAGIESATELFRNLMGNDTGLESIFVVSHSDVPDFDSELTFVKQDGITTLGD